MRLYVQLQGLEQVIGLEQFESLIHAQKIRPDTLIRRSPQEEWQPAGNLEIFRAVWDSPQAAVRRDWESRTVPWATAVIVGLNLRVFAWTYGTEPGVWLVEQFSRNTSAMIENRESYRLFSYAFLHGGIEHVVMNMLFIAYAGVAIESLFGPWGVVLVFMSGVFAGSAVSSVLLPANGSIGASAGDFGMMAALIAIGWRYADILPPRSRPAFGVAILIFTLQSLLQTFGSEGVDYWAHAGGLVGGGIVATLLTPKALPQARVANLRLQGVLYSTMVVLMVGIAAAGPALMPFAELKEDGISSVRPALWESGWISTGQFGWGSVVGNSNMALSTYVMEESASLQNEVAAAKSRIQAADEHAEIRSGGPVAVSGVAGERLDYTLTNKEQVLTGQIWIGVRGHYVHMLVVESENPALTKQIFDTSFAGIVLSTPESVEKLGTGLKNDVERLLRLGNQTEAIQRAEAAMAANPADREAVLIWSKALLDPPRLEKAEAVHALAAQWAADRKVTAELALTLAQMGRTSEGLTLLDTAEVRWPGDKTLARGRRKILELQSNSSGGEANAP